MHMSASTYVVGLAVMVAGVMAAEVVVVALVEEVKEVQLLDTGALHAYSTSELWLRERAMRPALV
jgi:hypothetical protein